MNLSTRGGRRETKKQRPLCNGVDRVVEQTTDPGVERADR